MESSVHSPLEIANNNIKSGITKANLPLGKMILLGIMAGAFIALGGVASNVAVHNITDVGIARTLAGAIFPVGLMLVVFTGSELFTGNCLMLTAVLDKKIKALQVIRNLVVVYFSNLIGALIIDLLVFYSGQFNYSSGGLGAYTIKVALAKTTIEPGTAIVSGILCNILVCLAIIMAGAAKDVTGKILAIFFPIWAFVIGGFEHCVANMFYIPAGMLAATNSNYVEAAGTLYNITPEQCAGLTHFNGIESFLFVTIGNILGGMVFVALIYYMAHKKEWK
ncbi:MAG: formate/nitrite transporter family protein [Acutalibacteraceae bacterium]|nr:formate/nitrite transporter family protein [Acutalibacteraceae bacterium]